MNRLLALAAVGLAPGSADGLPRDGWGDHLELVAREGLTGFLLEADRDGLVDLEEHERKTVVAAHEAAVAHSLREEAELIRTAPLLERLGAVVLKGPALAHGVYPDPSGRTFADIDVLVPPGTLLAAVVEFERLGYRRPWPEPSAHYLDRVAKAIALWHPAGLVLDLHRTLVAGFVGDAIDTAEILAQAIELEAGDVRIRTPRWEHHLIEVALHAAVGHGFERPVALRDVAQIVAAAPLDIALLASTAERWGVAKVVTLALERSQYQLPGRALPPELGAWVSSRPAGPNDRSSELFCRGDAVRSSLLRLSELRHGTLSRRATVLRSLIAPRPAFLRSHYGAVAFPRLYLRRWRDLAGQTLDARRAR